MFFILFFKIELGIWRVKNKPLHWDRKPGDQGFQGNGWEETEVGTGLRVIQKGTGWGRRAAGGVGPALPVLESDTRPACFPQASPCLILCSLHCLLWSHTRPALPSPGHVLASFSALSTALEACTPKGARNKACECDLGLQSPSPTTTMEEKGAKGMLVSTGPDSSEGVGAMGTICPFWGLLSAAGPDRGA